ncbi:MAG: hypothetical protein CMM84_17960 [Rhodothermaceae bacterium]|nr:hypothetical protein [Rhodothermaceae bacterium]MBC11694.1 hypothetical protein [Rhodothermaceae bacterium]
MATLPIPQPQPVPGSSVSLVAFYFPGPSRHHPGERQDAYGRWTPWDEACQAPFLGNFWPCTLTIQPPGKPAGTFQTAEAAFQATKWWDDDAVRHRFEAAKTGDEAYSIKSGLSGADPSYAGFSRPGPHIPPYDEAREGAMWAVLSAKFAAPAFTAGLLATGDAYLLEHNESATRDRYWSDGRDGRGENRLGLQLMALRATLGGSGVPAGAPSLVDLAATAQAL